MVKAVAGGGGRGMRPAFSADELAEAFERCRSEAQSALGNGDLYVEQLVQRARHIEVQLIGDGNTVSHLWERDCSLQRRRQKIVELAPAPGLNSDVRDKLIAASLKLGQAAHYLNLGTIEFLVDADTGAFFFIEANPRLQVEHTVTEEVTGLNLVELQLKLADGQSLEALGLTPDKVPSPRGIAMQLRINTETMGTDGEAKPGGGLITAFDAPSGQGIRVDSYGYAGYSTNPAYDSLLAKLIVHTRSNKLQDVMNKGYRALCEFNLRARQRTLPSCRTSFVIPAFRRVMFTPASSKTVQLISRRLLAQPTPTSISHPKLRGTDHPLAVRVPKWMARTPLPFLPTARQTNASSMADGRPRRACRQLPTE